MFPQWLNLALCFGLSMTLSSGLVKGNEKSLYFAFVIAGDIPILGPLELERTRMNFVRLSPLLPDEEDAAAWGCRTHPRSHEPVFLTTSAHDQSQSGQRTLHCSTRQVLALDLDACESHCSMSTAA